VAKLAGLAAFRDTLAQFRVPDRLVAPLSILIPAVEFAVSVMLVPSSTARTAFWAALALLVLFSLAVGAALARNEAPDCGCFGAPSSPVGRATLVRNVGLTAIAAAVAVAGPGDSLTTFDPSVNTALFAAAVAAIAGVGWFTWQLFQQNGRLLERIDALEAAERRRRALEGGEGGSPPSLAVHRINGMDPDAVPAATQREGVF
jgi:hypothetical protein